MYFCWSCRDPLQDQDLFELAKALSPWAESRLCRDCYLELEHGRVPPPTRGRGRRRSTSQPAAAAARRRE